MTHRLDQTFTGIPLNAVFKTKVVHKSKTTKNHNSNEKPLRTFGSIKLYVYVAGMTELVNLLICKLVAVPSILGSEFCFLFVDRFYPKTHLENLIDASTVPIGRHYRKQRSAIKNDTSVAGFQKRKGCVFSIG